MRTALLALTMSIAAVALSGLACGQEPADSSAPVPVPPAARVEPGPPPASAPAAPAPGASAARKGARESSEAMEQKDLRQLVETVKMVRLSQELGLTDEQTVIMIRKYERYRDDAAKLKREHQQLVRKLKETLKGGKPEAEVEKALQDLLAQDAKAAELRAKGFEEAGADLNPTQRAKLYVFLSDFEEDIRRMVEKAREAGAGRMTRMREMRDSMPPGLGPQEPEGEGRAGQRPPAAGRLREFMNSRPSPEEAPPAQKEPQKP